MSWLSALPIVGDIFKGALKIIDDLVPDKDLAAKIKAQMMALTAKHSHTEFIEALKAKKEIIVAEAQSESWIARNWRPLVMLMFGSIVLNNYIIYPYLGLFWAEAPMLDVPPDLWSLLKIGIGGYVVGRSGEKIIKLWKEPK